MIAWVTCSLLKYLMSRPSWPTPIHSRREVLFAMSGAVSSLIAATTISTPRPRAPSRTRNGKRPLPAIRPYFILQMLAEDYSASELLKIDPHATPELLGFSIQVFRRRQVFNRQSE